MTVTITKLPRDINLVRHNNCLNPSLETNQSGYTFLGNDATNTNTYGNGFPFYGGQGIYKSFGGQPANWEDYGFSYRSTNWPAGATRAVSWAAAVSIAGVQLVLKVYFRDAGGALLGAVQLGTLATTIAGVWGRVFGQFTAPAGTATADINLVTLRAGQAPGAGTIFAVDGLLIEDDGAQRPYFDGSIGAAAGDSVAWEGTPHASRSLYYQPDPRNVIVPQGTEGFEQTRDTGNAFFDILDDAGSVAVVLQPGLARSGTLKLLFGGLGVDPAVARAAADAAEVQHSLAATFTYLDDQLGTLGAMTYAVNGPVRIYASDSRRAWRLDVPFRNLS